MAASAWLFWLEAHMQNQEPAIELPSKSQIHETYKKYAPYFSAVMMGVLNRLEGCIHLSSQPTFKARIKSFDSYYRKVIRQRPREAAESRSLVCLTDMMGVRVICAFLEDLAIVSEQIKSSFDVREVERKGSGQNFKEFGYESIHVLVAIPADCVPPESEYPGLSLPAETVCEIQIRTILQDAWAEVEHELIYKTEFTPFDMPLRRKLASINASLSLADIIFQEIRDYQKKLQGELDERRKTFYRKADSLDEKTEAPKTLSDRIERVSPYVRGTIDDMILDAIHAHNSGDMARAVEIYSMIIRAKPEPPPVVLSVIHKHRGMAYFAESDYQKALSDFEESARLDPNNFRAIYYEGIVLAILKRHEEAIERYSRSIGMNEFQSHAFYRRALSYCETHEYDKALSDVASAKRLGLDGAECDALRGKILSRLDMGM